jgi:hypothetical protein
MGKYIWVTPSPTNKLGMRIEGELGAPLRIPVNNLLLARYEDAQEKIEKWRLD